MQSIHQRQDVLMFPGMDMWTSLQNAQLDHITTPELTRYACQTAI
jgi:hypothetical protein